MVQKTIGYGLYFDGDDYVKVDHYDALNISDVITVACWFKLDKEYTGTTWNQLITKSNAWCLFYNQDLNKLAFGVYGTDDTWHYSPRCPFTPDGKWHYLVGTYDGSTIRLYLDGEEYSTGTSWSGTINTNTNPVYIGQYCIGAISFVAVYQRALTAGEIRRSYISGRLHHPTSPKLLLEIDEGRGDTVYNRHYSYNDGSIVGAIWTEGHTVDRGCVYFDGSGARCPLYERGRNIDSEGVTVLVTLKWKETSSSEQAPVIKYSCYAFYIPANTDKMRWGVYSSSYGGWRYLEIDKFPRNTWTTLAGVYDKQNGILRLYKDGILMSEQTGIETDVSSTNDVCLGRYFKGWIRDVKIYDRVLSSSEIKYLSSTLYPKNKSKLRWWINFEQEGGYKISSLTGRGCAFFYDNSYCSSPASPIAETIEGCLDFDGVDDYVGLDDPSVSRDTFSVAFWFKFNSLDSNQHLVHIKRYDATGSASRFFLIMNWYYDTDGDSITENNFHGGIVKSDGTWSRFSWTFRLDEHPELYDVGEWHHLVVTVDCSNGERKIYFDGKLFNTATSTDTDPIPTEAEKLVLGANNDNGTPDGTFDGLIDDFYLFNRVLSEDEVRYLYLYRVPKNKNDLLIWYKFDERAGTTAIDYSGNGYDGTIYGARWKSYVRRLEVEEIKTEENVNFPSRVEIVSDHLEEPVVNRSIIVKRDSIDPVFTGVIEQIEKEEEGYSKRSRIIARDFSSLLEKKLTGSISYVDQKVEDIVSDLLDRNYCLQFDGDDYIQATFSATSLSSFTFELWAKVRGEGWLATLEESNYRAGFYLNAWGLNFELYDIANSSRLRDSYDYWIIQDDRWHHFVATYDGEHLVTYRDGEITSSDYYSGFSFSPDTFKAGYSGFRGDICLIRVYSRALSPDEVKDRYINNTNITDGLFIEYKFTEGSGSTLTDTSGNGYDASITGAVWSHHGVIGDVRIGETPSSVDIYSEWFQTSDTDFQSDTFNNTEISGTGREAIVQLKEGENSGDVTSELIQPVNLNSWHEFDAKANEYNSDVKFDILKSDDTVLVSDLNLSDLPYSLSSITESSIKVKAKFTRGEIQWINNTESGTAHNLRANISSDINVVGQRLNLGNRYVSKWKVKIFVKASALGYIYGRIWRYSDKSVLYTAPEVYDLSGYSEGVHWFEFTANFNSSEDVIIGIEYTDGYDNSYADCYDSSNVIEGHLMYRNKGGTWSENEDLDLVIQVYIYDTNNPNIEWWRVSYQADSMELDVDYDKKSDILERIRDLSNTEIYFDRRGLLNHVINRGVRKDLTLTIEEGVECDVTEHTETLPLVNKWKVIGETFEEERIEAEASDTDSINLYGEHQSVYVDNKLVTKSSALNLARQLVSKTKDPTYKRTVKELDEKAERIEAGDYIYLDSDDLSLKGGYRVERVRRTIDDSGELADLEITAKAKRIGEKIREIDEIRGWFK